jgi:hypothetical protein
MHAQRLANPSRESPQSDFVHPPDQTPPSADTGAVRGLLFAIALSSPFWLALYLLLR